MQAKRTATFITLALLAALLILAGQGVAPGGFLALPPEACGPILENADDAAQSLCGFTDF